MKAVTHRTLLCRAAIRGRGTLWTRATASRQQCLQGQSAALNSSLNLNRVSCFSSSSAVPSPPSSTQNDGAMQPTLTFDMALSVSRMTLSLLEEGMPGVQLSQVRSHHAEKSLMGQWTEMMRVVLMAQVHQMIPWGFSADEPGIRSFNQQMGVLMATHERKDELLELEKAKSRVMLTKTFDVSPGPDVSVETARSLTAMVAARLQSPQFDAKVNEAKATYAANTPEETHEMVLQLIMNEQMAVMEEYGYKGDDGYVKLQVSFSLMTATQAAFDKCGIQM